MANSRPLSCCLSLRRTLVPTWKVTTSALAGVSTVIACWDTSGTLVSTTYRSPSSDAGSRADPVPVLDSVWSMLRGILAILPEV